MRSSDGSDDAPVSRRASRRLKSQLVKIEEPWPLNLNPNTPTPQKPQNPKNPKTPKPQSPKTPKPQTLSQKPQTANPLLEESEKSDLSIELGDVVQVKVPGHLQHVLHDECSLPKDKAPKGLGVYPKP